MRKTLSTISIGTSITQPSASIEAAELTFQASIGTLQSVTGLLPVVDTVLSPGTV